jgi:tetratricopeptide (TPR) repeat protein
MKFNVCGVCILGIFVVSAILFAPSVSQKQFACNAQGFGVRGNTVSGNVYGINRQPMAELYVELQDDLHRTISRTRTNASGYYEFHGFSAGRLFIRVMTLGTGYEEQEGEIEIQNTTIQTADGTSRPAGFDDQQKDFYLRLRAGITPESVAIFAQEIPAEAKKLYEKGVNDLDAKRDADGLAELRQAIEKFPKYYYALERLGTEYVRLARPETFQAAEILFSVAVEVNSRGFKSWYGLAYARYSLGNTSAALEAVQKAVELNSYSPDALLLSGSLLRASKKYAEAEKQLLKARDLAKETMPQIHWELALLYGNHMKRYAEAAKELKLFLKAKPNAKDAENIQKLITTFESKAAQS